MLGEADIDISQEVGAKLTERILKLNKTEYNSNVKLLLTIERDVGNTNLSDDESGHPEKGNKQEEMQRLDLNEKMS